MPEIRAPRRRARPAPCGRSGRRWADLRCLRAEPARPPPRRRPRCARAQAQAAGPRRALPAAGAPAAAVDRRYARRRRLVRDAQGSGMASRTPLGAGSGLAGARGESSSRPAARSSASAGSCLPLTGSQATLGDACDCARLTPLLGGLLASSGRPLRPAATGGGPLRRAASTPASVDASGPPFSSRTSISAH